MSVDLKLVMIAVACASYYTEHVACVDVMKFLLLYYAFNQTGLGLDRGLGLAVSVSLCYGLVNKPDYYMYFTQLKIIRNIQKE